MGCGSWVDGVAVCAKEKERVSDGVAGWGPLMLQLNSFPLEHQAISFPPGFDHAGTSALTAQRLKFNAVTSYAC